jgi:hypothetical protein
LSPLPRFLISSHFWGFNNIHINSHGYSYSILSIIAINNPPPVISGFYKLQSSQLQHFQLSCFNVLAWFSSHLWGFPVISGALHGFINSYGQYNVGSPSCKLVYKPH